MDDTEIVTRIQQLAAQEHDLYSRAAQDESMTDEERAQLRTIQSSLDQCWDLLRQRRARRLAGQDPETAETREVSTLDKYLS